MSDRTYKAVVPGRPTPPRHATLWRALAGFHADAIIAIALAAASLVVYWRTLAPGVVYADGGEFQFAAWNFAFVHPTGYPLFLILGGLFQHLVPIGDPAYRLNLFTALTASLTVAVLYLAVKELTGHRAAAFVAALTFALTRTFWHDAGAAEVYDLNAFFLAVLLLLALRWRAAPSVPRFSGFCFAYGLALTHHRTIILWAPAFALFFIILSFQRHESQDLRGLQDLEGLSRTRSSPGWHGLRFVSVAVLLFLLPFLLYLYVPLRAPASPYAVLSLAPGRDVRLYDASLTGLAQYLIGSSFQHELGWDAASAARLESLPQRLVDEFGILGIALGLAGLGTMFARRDWARLALLAAGLLATVAFASLYHIGDIVHYYIPAYLVWAIWVGIGLAELMRFLDRRLRSVVRGPRSVVMPAWCAVVALALLFPQFTSNLAAADRSHETQARNQWESLLAARIPDNAILLSNDRDDMMPLWYIQYVENRRRDLLGLFPLITPDTEHANIVRLTDSALETRRPVYFIKPMAGLEIKYRLATSLSLPFQVLGQAADMPPCFPSDALIGGSVRIVGYDVAKQMQTLRVVIYWEPQSRLNYDYTTFVQLVDERGQKVAQGTDHQLGGEMYPTSLWEPGQVLKDEQRIVLPPNLAPQSYSLVVGMYRQPDMDPLGDPVVVGKFDLR